MEVDFRDSKPDIDKPQGNPDCLDLDFTQKCSLVNDKHSNQNQVDVRIARIPSKFLNSLGYINYDHYGNVPWTKDEMSEIFISREYKSITNYLAIDCETVGVGRNGQRVNALGRVSIVNEYGYCIYDTFVNPLVEITDYATQYSGVRAEDVATAPPVTVVRKKVAQLVRGKVLVGHSVHYDLNVLRLRYHTLIRDTATYFKQMTGAMNTPSLKQLTKDYLNGDIQSGEHSSIEDAQAAMKLYSVFSDKWENDLVSNTYATSGEKKKMKLPCGHKQKLPVDTDISVFKCVVNRLKELPCGHQQNAPCHLSPSAIQCFICSMKNLILSQASQLTKCNENVANIPLKFLNPLGFINYDTNGNVPWTDDEMSEIYLSEQYKSITNFLGIGCEIFEVGVEEYRVKLGRVSIVNEYGYCIYDTLVNQYSGIRPEDEATAVTATLLEVVRQKVAELIQGKTLIGHFFQHELRILKLQGHSDIRNAAKYFPKLNTAIEVPSLKELTEEYLGVNLQSGEHTSIEDAQAAIKLHSLYCEKWEQTLAPNIGLKENIKLPCGHTHKVFSDTNLVKLKCERGVVKYLPCGHPKNVPCHYSSLDLNCEICFPEKPVEPQTDAMVSTITLSCGHSFTGLVHNQNNTKLKYNIILSELLSCGHPQRFKCGSKPISNFKCKLRVLKQFPCGHDLKVACGQDISIIKCRKELKKHHPCGHEDVVTCGQNVSNTCSKNVTKALPCEHVSVRIPCLKSETYQCVRKKNVVLNCGHEQKVPCNTHIGSNFMCFKYVNKDLPCGHKQNVECHRNIPNIMCFKKITKKMPCGHEREVKCCRNISKVKCLEDVMKIMPCGHQKKSPCHKSNVLKCDDCGPQRRVLSEVRSPNPRNSSIKLQCGHLHALIPKQLNTINVPIGDNNNIECNAVITKNLVCGHVVTLECGKLKKYECRIKKETLLTCGHEQMVPCGKKVIKFKCIATALKDLPCGHQQKNPCHQSPFAIKCGKCAAKNS